MVRYFSINFRLTKISLRQLIVHKAPSRCEWRLLGAVFLALYSAVAAAANQSVMEEVVVTAQKREQDQQDVSLAISAFSGDAIKKMGFEEGLDITQQVPNMNFFAIFGEASSPSISLRGISLVNFSDSWESPVSLYVDDVYRGNPAGSAIQLFDLARVEVLRGPQGTLYGRNTTGGLMHYVSHRPSDELDVAASLRLGSYSQQVVEAMFNTPIAEGIRARVAIKTTRDEGWQTNTLTGAPLNETDSLGYRAQLAFDTGADSELLFNLHGSQADQQSVGFAHMGYLTEARENAPRCSIKRIQKGLCTSATFAMTGVAAAGGNFDPEHVASSASEGLVTDIDTFGASATLSVAFEHFDLTSITAYEELDKFLQDDGDGTAVVWFDEQYSVDAEQYSQELRLTGSSEVMRWVAGFYYYKDDRGLITQAPTTADGLWHQEVVALDTESSALFGQVEYDLTTELTLLLGARYTTEERDFRQVSGPSFYQPLTVTDDLSESASTGRIGLDWRPLAETLVYASLSTGFKSGGFSGSYNASLEATRPVKAEEMTNLELGLKTTLMDGRLRLNTAAFTYDVDGYQAQVFMTLADGGVITNAGDVSGTGLEAELTARVTDNFELIAGAGWLETEFDSQQLFKVAGENYPLDGNELPSAPGFTYNLVSRYYLSLGERGELTFQADYAWQDEHYLQIENDPFSYHDSYGIANAKLSWHSPTERFSAELFVENLANEEYFTYQNTLGTDWGYGVWGKPRTAGVRFGWTL